MGYKRYSIHFSRPTQGDIAPCGHEQSPTADSEDASRVRAAHNTQQPTATGQALSRRFVLYPRPLPSSRKALARRSMVARACFYTALLCFGFVLCLLAFHTMQAREQQAQMQELARGASISLAK